MRVPGMQAMIEVPAASVFRLLTSPPAIIGLPVLLQQHKVEHERPVPCLQTTIRRKDDTVEGRYARRVRPVWCPHPTNAPFATHRMLINFFFFREAEFRANITKNQKKRAQEQRQKEAQKREAEKENRKNLVGVRVIQKNLVYVTGLTPTVREDELTKTLRKPEFFGQYGNIQKISVSNRKGGEGQNPSLGIYVTFEKPEEAERCIRAVNGSLNGDRVLRAQLGTTKYCSAWLKHEQCTNRGCMFLHERGDEEDSYTRQDLSSMNSIHTQRPVSSASSSRNNTRQNQQQQQAAQQQAAQPPPTTTPSQAHARPASKDGSEDTGVDGSALPSSANWARNPQRSRRGSHATSGAAPSPAISASLPATTEEAVSDSPVAEHAKPSSSKDGRTSKGPGTAGPSARSSKSKAIPDDVLRNIIKKLHAWNLPELTPEIAQSVELYPPMFDIRGGEKRRAMREEEEARLAGEQEETVEAGEPSEGEPEAGGSLALGGEPEEREPSREAVAFDPRRGSQPPIQRSNADGIFGPALSQNSGNIGSVGSRSMTPQQQQQMFMRPQSSFAEQHLPPGISTSGGLSSLVQQQQQQQQSGHSRQTSRFSFANENSSGAASVQLAANPRIMAQQKSMMPSSFPAQQASQFYTTSVPGPPPGLKSTGTPPSMFGQGPSFGGSPFGAAPKDSNADLLQSIIRGRAAAGSAQAHDATKREYMSSPFSNQYPTSSTPAPAAGLLASLYGNQPGAFQDFGPKQRKKGKKHRHANTSSSGGSGLVDLADPSILQARMQHQSQSNAGVGQGLFGGQSQGGYNPSMMYNSSYTRW